MVSAYTRLILDMVSIRFTVSDAEASPGATEEDTPGVAVEDGTGEERSHYPGPTTKRHKKRWNLSFLIIYYQNSFIFHYLSLFQKVGLII